MSDDHITPDWIRAMFPASEWFDPCPYPRPSWDGLKVAWKDKTFANIPYGRKSKVNAGTEAWADKAIAEYRSGVSPIAVLSRHDHSTQFYAKMHLEGAHILLINERVQFLKPDGQPNTATLPTSFRPWRFSLEPRATRRKGGRFEGRGRRDNRRHS